MPSLAAMLLGDLTLVTDVPEVLGVSRSAVDGWKPRYPAGYRAGTRLRYTGPLYARLDLPVPAEVEAFLAEPGPVVYVALSSSTRDLVLDVVSALDDRAAPYRVLVAGTVHDLQGVPELDRPGVLVGGVLPSHLIMPRVTAAVITGGQGTVQTAIASGLPFAGIALQPEQAANIALVQRQGAALAVPCRPSPDLERLPALVRRLLSDSSYRERARHLQRAFSRVDGPGASADAIIELARSTGTPVTGSRPR